MEPIKIILSGNPLSTQSIYKTHCKGKFPCLYMSREGKQKKEGYQWQAKQQYNGNVLACPLSLEIELYFGDERKRDIDNFNKLVFDSLAGIIFKDDEQIEEITIKKFVDKIDPRIEIAIKGLLETPKKE